jgi:hypothetical protein
VGVSFVSTPQDVARIGERLKKAGRPDFGMVLKLETRGAIRWYVENRDVKLEPKDTVEVKGSGVTLQGKPVLLAAEVKKGDATLVLRDEAGIPAWTGVRRR